MFQAKKPAVSDVRVRTQLLKTNFPAFVLRVESTRVGDSFAGQGAASRVFLIQTGRNHQNFICHSTSQNRLNKKLKYYSVSAEILEYALCILTIGSVGVQEVV